MAPGRAWRLSDLHTIQRVRIRLAEGSLPIKAIVPTEGAPYVPLDRRRYGRAVSERGPRLPQFPAGRDRPDAALAREGFRPAVPGYESKAPLKSRRCWPTAASAQQRRANSDE